MKEKDSLLDVVFGLCLIVGLVLLIIGGVIVVSRSPFYEWKYVTGIGGLMVLATIIYAQVSRKEEQ